MLTNTPQTTPPPQTAETKRAPQECKFCGYDGVETLTHNPHAHAAAREIAAYEADIYKAKRNARVAKKGGLR